MTKLRRSKNNSFRNIILGVGSILVVLAISSVVILSSYQANKTKTDSRADASTGTCANGWYGCGTIGFIDPINATRRKSCVITGWAMDTSNAEYSIRVNVYANDKFINQIFANKPRPEVNEATGLNGNHGYTINLSNKLTPGKNYKIEILAEGAPNGSANKKLPSAATTSQTYETLNCTGTDATVNKSKSSFVNQQVSKIMTPGSQQTVEVTFKNSGETAWTREQLFNLGSMAPQDNQTWGFQRVQLEPGEVINPGDTKTFKFAITAPTQPGTYNFRWMMVQDKVAWFGDKSKFTTIRVKK